MRRPALSLTIAIVVAAVAMPSVPFVPSSVAPRVGAAANDQCVATHARISGQFADRALKIRHASGALVGSRHWALAVSPDANRIAYIDGTADPGYRLLISDIDGSNERTVYEFGDLEVPSTGQQYLWSPGGHHIAFTASNGTEQGERLKIVDVETGTVTFTSAFEVTRDGFDWAPDGSKIGFVDASDVFDGADIWTVNADGTAATLIVDHTASSSSLPPWNTPKSVTDLRWSPDGTRIAFSGRNGLSTGGYSAPSHELYLMNANGSGIHEIGRPPGPDSYRSMPMWSPDSGSIAYGHTVNVSSGGSIVTTRGITIVNLTTNALTEVSGVSALDTNYEGQGFWLSANGGTLVFPAVQHDPFAYGVHSIPVAGGTPVNIEPHESQTGLANAIVGVVRCDAVLTGTYTPVVPARLLETRAGGSTADGQSNGIGMRAAGSVTELVVTGRGGIPADATAVVLNVAVTEAQDGGFITVFPCGSPRPTAANLNYGPGDTVPNLVIAKVGVDGKVCLYTYAATHIIADANGAFGPGTMYTSLAPARLLESRPGFTTIDGESNGIGLRPAGSVTELVVAGRAGVPADAAAVVLNVAVTGPQASGFITAYPCGAQRPTAANLNYVAGQTVPNLVIAKVGAGGKVCLYTLAATHIVADVNGAFATGTSYQPVVPARIADTRNDGTTVDDQFDKTGKIRTNQRMALIVAGRAGIPDDASSVVLNIAVTDPEGPGFITVYPCDAPRPTAANLNYAAGQTVPNLVVAKVGAAGDVCIYSYASAHVVVDVNGVFPDY